MVKLSIVVPCFNEQAVLPETARRLDLLLSDLVERKMVTANSQVWFVDDGSRDETWSLIERFSAESARFAGVRLSRNQGHQNALLAGLEAADGDVFVTVDADLQDDLAVIEKMLECHAQGAEIVYGVRRSRETDTFFKRLSARGFYRFLGLMGVEVVFDHADYRLMSCRAVDALFSFPEVNLFLRGVVPRLGFKTDRVFYDRAERFAGETKYPLRKMVALALDGITSFSAVPLRMIALLGALVFLISLVLSGWVLGVRLFTDQAFPGWASTTLAIYVLGGIQLFCMGVLGEYLAKTYMETKRRPRYFLERVIGRYEVSQGIQVEPFDLPGVSLQEPNGAQRSA